MKKQESKKQMKEILRIENIVNKSRVTKSRVTKKVYYKQVFDALMYIGINSPKPPKKILESWDIVADFIGDVASGRRK